MVLYIVLVSFLFLELVSVCSLFCTLTCSDNISQPTVVAQPNVGMLVGYYGGGGGSDGGGGGGGSGGSSSNTFM